MTIRFLCPHGHKLAVPDNLAGKKGRCPICRLRVYIPVLDFANSAEEPATDGEVAEPSASGATATHEPGLGGMPGETVADAQEQSLAGLSPEAGEAASTESAVGPPGPPPIPAMDGWGENEFPSEPPVNVTDPPFAQDDALLPPPMAGEPSDPPVPQELAVIIDEPEEGYQADPGKVQTTYMLALALGALTLLCAAPALRHPNLFEAPNWARVVLIVSAVQLVFVCWMVSLPDWSTVWICMVIFAIVAAIYGMAWAVITFTPDYMPVNLLDLDEPPDDPVRGRAGPWCFVVLMLATLLTYACGRFSGRWRKHYEMAKAMRD
jgi:hypothetical protein